MAPEPVGDQTLRHYALSFQQFPEEPLGGLPIATRLYQDVEHIAVLVDRSPQVLLSSLNLHEEFVQVPGVPEGTSPVPQSSSVVEAKGLVPVPNRLIRHRDAPFGEQILNIAELRQNRW